MIELTLDETAMFRAIGHENGFPVIDGDKFLAEVKGWPRHRVEAALDGLEAHGLKILRLSI
jgi:hypothetical protein